MAQHNELGRWGESQAAAFLEGKGYHVLHRDWKSGHRDLDIVAITPDGGTLVVAEVKTRRNTLFAEPSAAVDRRKIRSLTMAAHAYVQQHRVMLPIRFDIITVVAGETAQIEHIEDAFLPLPINR
ncbi:MAG: YraN family protein [Prevotella sp.]|nr:YraN family protein [Prevotella sp.]